VAATASRGNRMALTVQEWLMNHFISDEGHRDCVKWNPCQPGLTFLLVEDKQTHPPTP
jgi:hypothetical protein